MIDPQESRDATDAEAWEAYKCIEPQYARTNQMLANGEMPMLPENRTEDDNRALLHWLEATTQTESHCIGAQPDENGVEREVWQHTMTPLSASPKQWGEADPFFDNPRASCALARMVEQAVKLDRSEERARKRTRRQRRAAQRQHNRGR
jgi:hypothetical protein